MVSYIGGVPVDGAKVGSSEVSAMYIGGDRIYQAGPVALAITQQPTGVLKMGDPALFTVETSGSGPKYYNWQTRAPVHGTWQGGSTGSTLQNFLMRYGLDSRVKMSIKGFAVRCLITNELGTITTNEVIIDPTVADTAYCTVLNMFMGDTGQVLMVTLDYYDDDAIVKLEATPRNQATPTTWTELPTPVHSTTDPALFQLPSWGAVPPPTLYDFVWVRATATGSRGPAVSTPYKLFTVDDGG